MPPEPAVANYPPAQRDNLLQSLLDDLQTRADHDSISIPRAFARTAITWLGDEGDGIDYSTDGAADRGIDAYRISPESIVLYQFKGRESLDKAEILKPASTALTGDVSRVISLLTAKTPISEANDATQKLVAKLRSDFYLKKETMALEGGLLDPPLITLRLALMANGLTTQANEELNLLRRQNDVIEVFGIESIFDVEVFTFNEFIATKWKNTNSQWKDSSGRNNETMRLNVEGQKIKDKTSLIFYTRAVDLINGFNTFGYQLFEPNVRCKISGSRVNREIGKQIETEKGMDHFKDLNNGVTMVYESFSEKEKSISLKKPGIVNGLQTVTTLAAKYNVLSEELKEHFNTSCHILVRLYGKHNVNVPTLVKATNNQNPMEPRNLRSNDPEQILLERRFAELGWFYERKDYAWEAFISEQGAWPTLKNMSRRNFQVQNKPGRPVIRRVDNQDVAQSWLAFTGFANEAVQRKRDLFVEDRFYEHAFKSRPTKHGADYNFSYAEASKAMVGNSDAPLAETLLIAFLCDFIARTLTPSGRAHRDASIQRLNLVGRKREDQDVILNEDALYLAGLIRTSAPSLFTEICGYVLFRALGGNVYKYAPAILRRTDIGSLYRNYDIEPIRSIAAPDNQTPGLTDLFSTLWLMYTYLTDNIADDTSWRNSFFQQSSRPRFLYSADMRQRLKRYVDDFDRRLSRTSVPLAWVGELEKKGGIFSYAKAVAESVS